MASLALIMGAVFEAGATFAFYVIPAYFMSRPDMNYHVTRPHDVKQNITRSFTLFETESI